MTEGEDDVIALSVSSLPVRLRKGGQIVPANGMTNGNIWASSAAVKHSSYGHQLHLQ